MLVYTMFAVVIAICWGIFQDKYLALASLYAWGIGDAFAALIGKKYGRHKIKGPKLDGKKSYEGTITMFLVSFITVVIILIYRGGLGIIPCVIISFIVATVSTISEPLITLIIGLGLFVGQRSTQIADFVRRSAELLGIIMAYVVYKLTT